jgi:hypothetical protein
MPTLLGNAMRVMETYGARTCGLEWNPVARRFKEGLPAVLGALAAGAAPPAATPSAPPPTALSRPTPKITVDNYDVVPSGYGTEVSFTLISTNTVSQHARLKVQVDAVY